VSASCFVWDIVHVVRNERRDAQLTLSLEGFVENLFLKVHWKDNCFEEFAVVYLEVFVALKGNNLSQTLVMDVR